MLKNGRYTKTCKRVNQPGHAHELTFSCYRNQPFLQTKIICDWLIESIQKARGQYGFSLWAYVFMPDHVHLIIHPHQRDYSVSAILAAVKRPVAMKALSYFRKNKCGELNHCQEDANAGKYRFWQPGGGYDRNLCDTDTAIQMVRYIHLNPVRKGLVENPENWYYSSAARWAGLNQGSLEIDKQDWPVFT